MKYLLLCFSICLGKFIAAQQPLAHQPNQSIWLLNSNNTFASSLDSVIDRHFFEARSVTIQSLEPFPLDATYECLAYHLDTTQTNLYPQMQASFTGPQLSPKIVSQMLASKPKTLFLLRVLGDKQGEEYRFIGSMMFQLNGEPKHQKEIPKTRGTKISLINSKGQKITSRDTLVSKKYFQTDWVDVYFGKEPDSSMEYWVVIQPPEGAAKAIKMFGRRLMEEAKSTIVKAPVGSKVFIINQQPDQNQTLMFGFRVVD
jgi:hypothetical protein